MARAQKKDERPPAPWGSFPLIELLVFVGLVLLVAGFISGGFAGGVMVGGGLLLASLAGLELAVREHWAGYRSHTLMLSGAAGVATIAGLSVAASNTSPGLRIGAGVAILAAVALYLRRVFRNRSGGASFKL